jgi:hypothetical protein
MNRLWPSPRRDDRAGLAPLLMLAALTLFGCQHERGECRRLTALVNQRLEKQAPAPKTDDTAAHVRHRRELAKTYDELAEALTQLSLRPGELQKLRTEYANLVRRSARHVRDSATAAQRKDEAAARREEAAYLGATKKQGELARKIEKVCLSDE